LLLIQRLGGFQGSNVTLVHFVQLKHTVKGFHVDLERFKLRPHATFQFCGCAALPNGFDIIIKFSDESIALCCWHIGSHFNDCFFC
jgi:hypothetical protein